MSTAATTKSPKRAKVAARRKRHVAIGAGVGAGVGGILLLLYLAKEANADDSEDKPSKPRGGARRWAITGVEGLGSSGSAEPKQPKQPKSPGGKKKGGSKKGSGKKDPGGGRGPGGSGADADGPRRVNPSGGKKKDEGEGRRTNPEGEGRRTNPPKGPNPKFRDLDRYYNADWPDPGKFYQVGSRDSDGLYGIAWRWFFTSLYLAARRAGGLDEEAARAWASARVGPKGGAQATRADVILCAAWNDVTYGSFTVASKNRRGPHGRGIDLVPQHADNWKRIRQRKRVRRNVYLGEPGETGTPRNAGKGNAKLPLLWMPRLSDQRLWDSDGQELKVAGAWADGSLLSFPPPVVMNLGIDDATNSADLNVWGCGAGEASYG